MKKLILLPALALFACGEAVATDANRQTAEQVIRQVVQTTNPGLFVPPLANCMINNATNGEVLALTRDAQNGLTDKTTAMVLEIGRRDASKKCFIDNGQNVTI